MKFANPQALHLLWFLPLIAVALHFFYEHRCRMTSRFVEAHLQEGLVKGLSKAQYRLKAILMMMAFFFMVIAFCRPQWGYSMRPVKRHGLDIMVVIDVSKSMLTQDVKPSRLERTKLAIKDLVMKLNGSDHIGLIAFAGDAMVMCPLTYDYNGFLLSLDDLSTDTIPRGGTDIAQAIDESVKAYQGMQDSDKAVVLVTDGEDEEGDAIAAARKAKEQGVRIFTVGVGTREGDLIQIINSDGQPEFLKDSDGNVVKSHLNESLLQQIAYVTGGAYIRSGGTQFGLDYLYDKQLSRLKKHDNEEKMAKMYDERFQWPLTIAFIFLIAEMVIGRKVSLRAKRSNLFNKIAASPLAPRNDMKKILSLVLFIMLFMPRLSFASVASDVNKANALYKQGKYDDSLDLYQDALGKDDTSSVVNYDLGTAYYKKGDYEKALQYLQDASQGKDDKIKPRAEYNLGNVLYKSGVQKENTNVDEAIKSLQEALGHYSDALSDDPKDQEAQYNEDFVKKVIERLKERKQEQQQQQQRQQNQQQDQKNSQNQQNQQDQKAQQGQDKKDQQKQQQSEQQQQNKATDQKDKQQSMGPQDQKQKPKTAQELADEGQKEIDRKQVEDLLEDYRENEEPKKLLNYMPKKIDDRPVLKDW